MMKKKTYSVLMIILILTVFTGYAQETGVKINKVPESGFYSGPDYPNKIFDIPEQQHPAPDKALKEWSEQNFGLLVCWGIYSVPGGIWKGEKIGHLGEQIQAVAKIPGKEYDLLAKEFNPVNFDADEYAKTAKAAGMKYIILTSKFHDGFCMFDSKYTDFDIMDASPYRKDIVKEFADACAKYGIKFGVYYSNPDWHFDPPDQTVHKVNMRVTPEMEEYENNQLEELLTKYGPLFEIFFDMGRLDLEQSAEFAKTVRRLQPNCIVSGRVMNSQGDFFTMSDNAEPSNPIETPWEVPCTLSTKGGHTWGYKSWVEPMKSVPDETKGRIHQLSRVASKGGNYLLNIGPLPDGTIQGWQKEVLLTMGEWIEKNKEAVFDVNSTPFHVSTWGHATWRKGKLYLHIQNWPKSGVLKVPNLLTEITDVSLLTDPGTHYEFEKKDDVLTVNLPASPPDDVLTVLVAKFKGKLKTSIPHAKQDGSGNIILDKNHKLTRNFYHGMLYRSSCANIYTDWHFETEPGKYNVSFDYKMRANRLKSAPPIVIIVNGQEFHVQFDQPVDKGTVNLGEIEFKKAGKYKAVLVPDVDVMRARFAKRTGREALGLKDLQLWGMNVERIKLTSIN